uniref:Uncharacterized protein n=1 Tax=Ailuropoda melanoleuca TaxID=9646 RepID=A0A7N5K3L1_AILME
MPRGANRQLNCTVAEFVLCAADGGDSVSGARGPCTGAHISPQSSASGVTQTPVVEVSIQCMSHVAAGYHVVHHTYKCF